MRGTLKSDIEKTRSISTQENYVRRVNVISVATLRNYDNSNSRDDMAGPCNVEENLQLLKSTLSFFNSIGCLFIVWDDDCAFRVIELFLKDPAITYPYVLYDLSSIAVVEATLEDMKTLMDTEPYVSSMTVVSLLHMDKLKHFFTELQEKPAFQVLIQRFIKYVVLSVYDDISYPFTDIRYFLLEGMIVFIAVIRTEDRTVATLHRARMRPSKEFYFIYLTFQINRKQNGKLNPSSVEELKTDMNGRELLVCTVPEEPFSSLTKTADGSEVWNERFDWKLLDALKSQFNFTFKIVLPDRFEVDGVPLNRSWHNIIIAVMHRRVDIGVSELEITFDRIKLVDIGYHYYSEQLVIITKKRGELARTFIVYRPFVPILWLLIVISIPLYAAAYLIVTFVYEIFRPPTSNRGVYLKTSTYFECLWLVFGAFVRGLEFKSSSRISQRTLVIFWSFFAFILSAIYQGSLTSHLTISIPDKPIDNRKQLSNKMDSEGYSWIVTPGSTHELRFKRAPDGIYKDLYMKREKGKLYPQTTDVSENLKTVLNNKVALFTARTVAEYATLELGKEKFHIGTEKFFLQQYGIAFQRGAPYRHQFDLVVARIVESGLAFHWMENIKHDEEIRHVEPDPENKTKEVPIELQDLQGAFLLLFIGYLLSSLVFVVELNMRKKKEI